MQEFMETLVLASITLSAVNLIVLLPILAWILRARDRSTAQYYEELEARQRKYDERASSLGGASRMNPAVKDRPFPPSPTRSRWSNEYPDPPKPPKAPSARMVKDGEMPKRAGHDDEQSIHRRMSNGNW